MRFMAIAFPLVLLMDAILFVNCVNWHSEAVYEYEQRQMDLQVNYSVDAAMQEMLAQGTHIDTDYADWGSMSIEPEVAYDTYVSVLIRNLGWADSPQNRQDLVESSIPFFCVAAYDGYYMLMRQHDTYVDAEDATGTINHVYNMRWTPKLPYSDTVWDANTGKATIYLYNLGDDKYGTYKESTGVLKLDNMLKKDGFGNGSKAQAQVVVNDVLTKACNSALFVGLEGDTDEMFYIPAMFSEWSSSNPVSTPSILTYISRSDQHTQYDTVTFGIGGAKVDDAKFCICYTTSSGQKLYTWARNRDEVDQKYGINGNKQVIDKVTTTAKEAAESGYYFDVTVGR